jgi:hypothetical protein
VTPTVRLFAVSVLAAVVQPSLSILSFITLKELAPVHLPLSFIFVLDCDLYFF